MCNKQTNPNKCKNQFTVPLFLVKHLMESHAELSIALSHSQIQPKDSWKSIKISSSIKSLLHTSKIIRPEEKIMNTLPKGQQTSTPRTCFHLAGLQSTLSQWIRQAACCVPLLRPGTPGATGPSLAISIFFQPFALSSRNNGLAFFQRKVKLTRLVTYCIVSVDETVQNISYRTVLQRALCTSAKKARYFK